MKKGIILLFALTVLFLAGCQVATPEPTALPATAATSEESAPQPEPTREPSEPGTDRADTGTAGGLLPDDLVTQLDAFLRSQVFYEGGVPEGASPGLVLLVDTPDVRYLKAAGVANLEVGTPMQVDDILQIGSNSKSMTIVLLMQLQEEGLLSLDDPLSKWLPDQAAILPNGDQIILRHLAQHTAGTWDYADDILGAGISDPSRLEDSYTPQEIVQYAADNGTPYFNPGEEGKLMYSNTGYILLGMVIEAVTGEKLADLYRSRIFVPLGMESAVLIEGVPQAGEITTQGYRWTEEGERLNTTSWNASQGWAAGAAAMTAEDLAVYGKALAGGELFQDPDTLLEMLSFNPAAKYTIGGPYGLGLIDYAGDGSVWGHGGQTLGFSSLWFIDPEKGIIVIGLTNSANYNADGVLNVLQILEGDGTLPVAPYTLLPIGFPTKWQWVQFVTQVEATEMDATADLTLTLGKDQSVSIIDPKCGVASGLYTVDRLGNLDVNIDASGLNCDVGSLTGQFVQHLNDAVSWHFDNGRLVIELPADGGSLIFVQVPPLQ